jgi:hypothetical protein
MRSFVVFAIAAALGGSARAGGGVPPAPPPAVEAEAAPPAGPRGVAIGVALGEPSSFVARVAVLSRLLFVDAAIGSGVVGGTGLELHGGLTLSPIALHRRGTTVVPLYLGAGAHYYQHHYAHASVDELDDTHAGVYGVLGVGLVMAHLEVFGEGGPGWDLSRGPSCSFASGVDTTCPHAQASPLFVHAVVGVRWYFGG